ncbi:hypothetical protein F5I97DRAFT_1243954 [Phlebopus sp. FC_14]|nr:hypothetical protein F5I97DRAFT_1243954 [Phlebopus sp. FC_14]
MVKSKDETVAQFNEQVNMTAEELERWLASDQSHKAGTGVGLESGAKIVDILNRNPDKDPNKYDQADLSHMRKVVGYNSRHLAQEDHLKETKTKEDLANRKSTISLKNWGHDPIKSLEEEQRPAGHEVINEGHEDRDDEETEHTKNLKRKRHASGESQSDEETSEYIEDDVGNQRCKADRKAETKSSKTTPRKQRRTSDFAAGTRRPSRHTGTRNASSRK